MTAEGGRISGRTSRRLRFLVLVQAAALVAALLGPLTPVVGADPSASPVPTDTAAPTDTPTQAPTDTASPAPTPDPSASPLPDPQPLPTPPASVDPSASGGASPSPSIDPNASGSPDPAPAPGPSATSAPTPVTVQLIVRFVAGLTAWDQQVAVDDHGGVTREIIGGLRMRVVELTTTDLAGSLAALRSDPRVQSVDFDRTRASDSIPNDAGYDAQWNLPRMAWDLARDSVTPAATRRIAVLDTGVQSTVPDLSGLLAGGWSALGTDAYTDPNGHGTAMAAIAAAATDNGGGIAGVAWDGVDLLSVQVLDANGRGTDSDVIAGVLWALDHGADVILMAFSDPGYSTALQAAIDEAWSRGAIVVAATGNDGSTAPTYPAGDRHVVGVTATDMSDALAPGANSGADTFIGAPGVAIPALGTDGSIITVAGTSAAAAELAGAAALLGAVDPTATNGIIVGRLARTADAAGTSAQTGNGRVDLGRAVTDTSTASIDPTGAPGGGPFVGPYTAAATKYWAGCSSTSWSDANNWSTNSAPTCTLGVPSNATTPAGSADTATILASRPFSPVLIAADAITVGGLTISASATMSVPAGTITVAAGSLAVAGTLGISGGTVLTAVAPAVTGTLNLSAGVLHLNASAATAPNVGISLTGSAVVNQSGTGVIDTYGYTAAAGTTWNQSGGTFRSYRNFANSGTYNATDGTIEFAGTNQNKNSGFPSPGTNQFHHVVVDSGVQLFLRGTSAPQLLVKGDWTINGSVSMTQQATVVTFNGTTDQTIGGTASTTFRNLTVNKTAGDLILVRNTTVGTNTAATLTLTSGAVVTNANILILGTIATVSRTSGFVEGNFQKPIAVGTNVGVTFEVGTNTTYAPIAMTIASVTTAGSLIGSSTAGQHPQIASSPIVVSQDVARYWTLAATGGLVFTTASITFTYVAGDVTGGTSTTFIVQRYSAGWTTPTIGTRTSTSAQVTGVSALGDFAVGTQVGTAADGTGTVTVSPTSLTAGAAGNLVTFAFTAPADADFLSGSGLTIAVPSGWSAPQTTSATTAGYVTTTAGTCTPGAVSVSGSGPWTITVAQACLHGTGFTVSYGADTATRVTAPKVAGTSTFTSRTREGAGGTLTAIATSPTIAVVPGSATQLQVLLPGETAAPGTGTGKSGAPTGVTAGAIVTATVNAVDQYFNLVTSVTSVVHITSSDPNATLPPDAALASGTGTYNVTLKTAGSRTVTAAWVSGGSALSAGTSSAILVSAGTATQLQVLLPGETAAPGTATGKTGTPTAQTAGTATTPITVNAVDAYFNVSAGSALTVHVTSTDANAALPADTALSSGTAAVAVTFKTAGSWTVTAARVSGTPLSVASGTTAAVTVNPAAATKLQVLLVGETAAPGTATGKTGTPTPVTSGGTLGVTVRAVDANWNLVATATPTVAITSTDANATLGALALPQNLTLSGGTATTTLTLRTAGGRTVTATYVSGTPSVAAGTSSSVTVNAGTATKLLLLLPGETAAPGTSAGKTGTPTAIVAGTQISATVQSVDAWSNLVSTTTTVHIAAPGDAQAVLPANAALSGGTGTFLLTLKTAGSQTVTASDVAASLASSSSTISVTPSTTDHFVLSRSTATPTAYQSFTVTVVAHDAYENVVPTYAGTVHFTATPSDASDVLPSDATLTAGQGTFNVIFKTPGGRTITATDTVTSSITGSTTVTVQAAVGLQVSVSLSPASITANGTATSVATVTVTNSGVPVTGDSVTFSTAGDATFASTTCATTALGTCSVTIIASKTADTETITATDTTPNPDVTGNATLTETPGAAAKLQVLLPNETAAPGTTSGKTGSVAGITAGGSVVATVRAVDANWNLVATSTQTVAITSSDPHATLPSNAALVAGVKTFTVTLPTAQSTTITANHVSGSPTLGSDTSSPVVVSAGAATKLQVLLPGETADPGSLTGVNGTPNAQVAGTAFIATIRATDAYFNLVTSATPTVHLTSSDAKFVAPADPTLVAGVAQPSVTLKTAGGQTLTATQTGGTPSGLAAATSSVVTVQPSTAVRLGVQPAASTVTAGVALNVTVTAYDTYDNVATGYGGVVRYTSSDGSATLPANGTLVAGTGTRTVSVTLRTAGPQTVTATDTSAGSITGTSSTITVTASTATSVSLAVSPSTITADGTSTTTATATVRDTFGNPVSGDTVTVTTNGDVVIGAVSDIGAGRYTATLTASKTADAETITATDTTASISGTATLTETAGAATKLQVLLPGESAAPGTVSGKTGAPTATTTGTAVSATVRAVDANWNLVSTAAPVVAITSSDANAILPANGALSGGTGTFAVTFKTAGSRTVTATWVSGGSSLTANTSSAILVNAGTATQLQVILPGETAAPGTATGKTGTPTGVTAGATVSATVRAVDAYFNLTSATPTVAITSSDSNATLPSNGTLVGGTGTFNVTLKTVGTRTITATQTAGSPSGLTASTSGGVVVTAGTATHFSVTPSASTVTAGVAFDVTFTALDGFGNTDLTYSGTVGFSSTTDTGTARVYDTTTSTYVLLNSGFQWTFAPGDGSDTLSFIYPTAGTGRTLVITDASDSTITGTGSFTVATAAAFNISLTLNPRIVTADGTSTSTATATVTNSTGTGLGGKSVSFSTNGDATFQGGTAICTTSSVAQTLGTCSVTIVASKTADTETITARDTTDSTIPAPVVTTATLTENPGPATQLQVLLPNETAAPGTVSGKSGTYAGTTAGSAVSVTVRAVDANWNLVNTASPTVAITSSDTTAALPSNGTLTAGVGTFSVTPKRAGTGVTITATDTQASGGLTANTSSGFTVNAGSATQLQVLLPGETAAPGTASGKSGTPTAVTAGSTVSVTIRAVDAFWNLTTATPTVSVTSSDANATLPSPNPVLVAGTVNANVVLVTAGARTVTATWVSGGSGLTANTSSLVTVNAATVAKLQILLPGETAAPGTVNGKTGTPTGVTAGATTVATVNAVDTYWNFVATATPTVAIGSSDANATVPSPAQLVAGTRTFNVVLKTAGSKTVTASDQANALAANSSTVAVSAAAVSQLQVLLPGETAAPGSATGKTGTPTDIVAGALINVTVNAVDPYFNLVATSNPSVTLTTSDPDAGVPAPHALSSGTWTFTGLQLKTAAFHTVSATGTGPTLFGTSASIHVNPGTAVKLQVLLPGEIADPGSSGTGKQGTPTGVVAGSTVSATVNAVDAYFNIDPTAGPTVAITSSDTHAVLPASGALVNGTRTFSVTLKTAGSRTITATDTAGSSPLAASTSSAVQVSAGSATHLLVLLPGETYDPGSTTGHTGTPTDVVVGDAVTATVRAVDDYHNVDAASNPFVTITSTDTRAVLPSAASLSSGVGTFSITFHTADYQTVTATGTSPALQGTSDQIHANPGPATHFHVVAPTSTTSGDQFIFTVTANDQFHNVATGYTGTLHFTSTDGSSTLPANATLVAGTGTGTFTATLRTAGAQTITATDTVNGTLTATSNTITVLASTSAGISLTLTPPSIVADPDCTVSEGVCRSTAAVLVFDASNNPVGGEVVTFATNGDVTFVRSLADPTPVTSCTTSTANDATKGTCSVVIVASKTAGPETISASIGSPVTHTEVAVLTETPLPAQKLIILLPGETLTPGTAQNGPGKTGTPDPIVAGVPVSVRVYAVDEYWNVDGAAAQTVHFTSTDPNAELPLNDALAGGTETFSVTFHTAGSRTLTVADVSTVLPAIALTTYTTSAFTVASGPVARLQVVLPGETAAPGTPAGVTGTPTEQAAGSAFSVTVNATDADGNVVSSATPTVQITTTDANGVLPSDGALSSGTGSFSVTFHTAGVQNVTAAWVSGGTELTTGTSSDVSVTHGTLTKLQILVPGEAAAPGTSTGKTGSPSNATAGVPFNVVVNATDAYWNVVDTANPTVHLTSTDGAAVLPANDGLGDGTETFLVTLKTAGPQTVTVTDTATSSPLAPATSGTITVVAATPTKLAFTQQPTGAVHGALLATQPIVAIEDDFGNVVSEADPVALAIAAGTPATGGVPGTLHGTTTVNAVNGVVTYAGLSIKGAGTGYRLRAEEDQLAPVDSDPFDITARAITVTAQTYTKEFDGTTATGTTVPLVTAGTLAAGDTSHFTQAFADALVGTGKTITPSGTITDDATSVDDTGSYLITWVTTTGSITGTILYAPSSIDLGSGFPGQVVTSDPMQLDWLTTLNSGSMTVSMGAAGLTDGNGHAIARADVFFQTLTNAGLSSRSLGGSPLTLFPLTPVFPNPDTYEFWLQLTIPSVPTGSYGGTLTFSVAP